MAPSPVETMVYREPVFSYIALDELGPLTMKDDANEFCKAYILEIACMAFRAIHLEVLRELSYDR